MRKIRIFLGAYVNSPNAQNVNCDNIAKCLDKTQFEVHTMYIPEQPIDKKAYFKADIHLHKLWNHRFVWHWSKYFTMLFGKYDIYYLPKRDFADFCFANKKNRGICISSIENVITPQTDNNPKKKHYFLNQMDGFFSISRCVADSVEKHWGVSTAILPLGIIFEQQEAAEKKSEVKTIVWVGNIKENKRPLYLLECAKRFPSLNFIMIGDGDMDEIIRTKIQTENIQNVTLTGRIPNSEVYQWMKKADLLLMTSRNEGLPKVIGEAMSVRVPTIYINEHYTVDYIEHGKNGFAVSNLSTMMETIQHLLDDSKLYRQASQSAYETIQDYTWDKLIKKYEQYFIEQWEKKHQRS